MTTRKSATEQSTGSAVVGQPPWALAFRCTSSAGTRGTASADQGCPGSCRVHQLELSDRGREGGPRRSLTFSINETTFAPLWRQAAKSTSHPHPVPWWHQRLGMTMQFMSRDMTELSCYGAPAPRHPRRSVTQLDVAQLSKTLRCLLLLSMTLRLVQ